MMIFLDMLEPMHQT